MNQPYKVGARDVSERRRGLQECDSYVTSCVLQHGPKQPSSFFYAHRESASSYSPLRRLQDMTAMVSGPDAGPRAEDFQRRCKAHAHHGPDRVHSSPNADNGFSPVSSDSLEHFSPIPNGFLHFESSLFDSGDSKDDHHDDHHDDSSRPSPVPQKKDPNPPESSSGQGLDLSSNRHKRGNTLSKMWVGPDHPGDVLVQDVDSMDEDWDSDCDLPSTENCAALFTSSLSPRVSSPSSTYSNPVSSELLFTLISLPSLVWMVKQTTADVNYCGQ